PVFDKIYSPDKELVPGKHHFVVWFNLFAPYSYTPVVENQYILGEMLFNLDVPVPPIVEHSMTRLPVSLYGYREESIALNGNTVVIPVVQNSNKINVNVYGLTPTQDEYRFSIQDNNGTYTCYNVFATCGTFEYVEWVTFPQMSPNKQNVSSAVSEETSLLSASFNVLKLAADRPNPELIISNNSTGEQLFPREGYTNNLIQMILAADAKNDFDKTHVYNIDITFGGNPDITIKVNGWNASESNVEIVP
ncbi:MAG: FimB/Mfa2 family fimbrial subunit, partial [Dysgonamonadaceae bacterium]|nr:FimB/Mfa2 family fimbrial subunit [Dysgonamonadaceae bacterium]